MQCAAYSWVRSIKQNVVYKYACTQGFLHVKQATYFNKYNFFNGEKMRLISLVARTPTWLKTVTVVEKASTATGRMSGYTLAIA
jgi:hypothetical protein